MKLILIFLLSYICSEADLLINQNNDNYNFTYKNDSYNDEIYMNLLEINSNLTNSSQLLKMNDSQLNTNLNPNSFYVLKVITTEFEDNNNGRYWLIQPSIQTQNSFYNLGQLYLGAYSNYLKIINLDSAESYFKKELNFYPKNILAMIALNSVQFDLKKIDYDNYRNAILEIYNQQFNSKTNYSEIEIKSIVRALKSISKNEIADNIEYNFITENPKSEYASEVFISKMAESKNAKEFENLSINFLKYFPNHSSTAKIMSAFISSELQNGNFNKIIKFIDNNQLPAETYYYLATRLIEFKNPGLEQDSTIIHFFDKSINLISNDNSKSQLESYNYRILLKEILYTKANYLLDNDSVNAAKVIYDKILLEMKNNINPKFFEHYLLTLSSVGERKQILELAIKNSNFSEKLFNWGSELFDNQWEVVKNNWIMESEKKRLKKLDYEMIDGASLKGFIKTSDKSFIDLESFNSKPTMIVFYSTWCGPCESMIPSIEEIESINNNLENTFNIIGISTWENPQTRWSDIYEHLESIEPNYKILVDETDMLPQKYGAVGLPTTIYLDINGKVSFIERGFTNSNDYIRNSIDKLKYLSKD
ncbi:TlpA disulfide reductase family protein [Candidatus Kapabacteria bacterium]|nr:TlpA disulfide reductase family protein [Candidatus Kapabacteria bacterium]